MNPSLNSLCISLSATEHFWIHFYPLFHQTLFSSFTQTCWVIFSSHFLIKDPTKRQIFIFSNDTHLLNQNIFSDQNRSLRLDWLKVCRPKTKLLNRSSVWACSPNPLLTEVLAKSARNSFSRQQAVVFTHTKSESHISTFVDMHFSLNNDYKVIFSSSPVVHPKHCFRHPSNHHFPSYWNFRSLFFCLDSRTNEQMP